MQTKQMNPESNEYSKRTLDVWISVGLLFVGALLTGTGFFLMHRVSSSFVLMVVIGILCFGFSCLGYNRLKDMSEKTR